MSEDVAKYIDKKFSDVKWFLGIIIMVLIVFLGWMGTATIKNRMYIKDLEFDIQVMNGRTKTLEYKILWIAEINELVRNYYKEGAGEVTIDFLEDVQKMEDRVMANTPPIPTLRSGYYKNE